VANEKVGGREHCKRYPRISDRDDECSFIFNLAAMAASYLFKMLTRLPLLTVCLQHQDISGILPLVAPKKCVHTTNIWISKCWQHQYIGARWLAALNILAVCYKGAVTCWQHTAFSAGQCLLIQLEIADTKNK
jgi:hypothetical protein